jgi:hypothetical protein
MTLSCTFNLQVADLDTLRQNRAEIFMVFDAHEEMTLWLLFENGAGC